MNVRLGSLDGELLASFSHGNRFFFCFFFIILLKERSFLLVALNVTIDFFLCSPHSITDWWSLPKVSVLDMCIFVFLACLSIVLFANILVM